MKKGPFEGPLFSFLVEAAGVEPASKNSKHASSTRIVFYRQKRHCLAFLWTARSKKFLFLLSGFFQQYSEVCQKTCMHLCSLRMLIHAKSYSPISSLSIWPHDLKKGPCSKPPERQEQKNLCCWLILCRGFFSRPSPPRLAKTHIKSLSKPIRPLCLCQ